MAQHKWHKEIKAWADGAEIEYRTVFNKTIGKWFLCEPNCGIDWEDIDIEYRIKPQPAQEPLTSLDEIFADEMFRLNRDIMPLPEHLIHEIAQRNYHPALGINPVAFTLDIEKAHGIGEQACKEALAQPLTRDWKETINERVAKDDAFKQALEQPAQEPVAWTSTKALQNAKLLGAGDLWLEFDENYAMDAKEIGSKSKQIPLYTHPAPSWQGLSDDEKQEAIDEAYKNFKEYCRHKVTQDINEKDGIEYWVARAIEQALKEKINGTTLG